MSREIKLGILTAVTLALVFIALNFIKGSNLFSKSLTFNSVFQNVAGLDVSSPVYLNGFKVGSVKSISINPENLSEMIVESQIEGDFKLPKSTTVVFRSDGLVSGNALDLKFSAQCTGKDCLKDGDFLKNETLSMLQSMLSDSEMDEVSSKISGSAKDMLSSIGDKNSNASIDVSARELEATLSNMTKLTEATNRLIGSTSGSMKTTMDNVASITGNLSSQNEKINRILNNLETLTKELSAMKLQKISDNASNTMIAAESSMKDISKTLDTAEKTFVELNKTLVSINDGSGSLGKLMNDKKLYDNLEMTSKNMSLLLQDMRLNPKRYVSVSVFGKKQKTYTDPKDDPAFREKNN